jgi:hypothetical protein
MCHLDFDAEAGSVFSAFVHHKVPLLLNAGSGETIEALCETSGPYTYESTEASSTTETCNPQTTGGW